MRDNTADKTIYRNNNHFYFLVPGEGLAHFIRSHPAPSLRRLPSLTQKIILIFCPILSAPIRSQKTQVVRSLQVPCLTKQ